MYLKPEALENIIVGVLVDRRFSWYVTPKDLWFLDKGKEAAAYREKFKEMGIKSCVEGIELDDERAGVNILNEQSFVKFAPRISKYAVSTGELRALLKVHLLTESDEDTYYRFLPSLYIDFDHKELNSLYTEPASYEDYVPENWRGTYEDFLVKINYEDKYWYDDRGKELLSFEQI